MLDFDLFTRREWLLLAIGILLVLVVVFYATFWFIDYYLGSSALS